MPLLISSGIIVKIEPLEPHGAAGYKVDCRHRYTPPIGIDTTPNSGNRIAQQQVVIEAEEADMLFPEGPAPPQPMTVKEKKVEMTLGAQARLAPMAPVASMAVNDHSQPMPIYQGRDRFEKIELNPVKLVAKEPVSTFSIDVDTASYGFVRRTLNNGYLPGYIFKTCAKRCSFALIFLVKKYLNAVLINFSQYLSGAICRAIVNYNYLLFYVYVFYLLDNLFYRPYFIIDRNYN